MQRSHRKCNICICHSGWCWPQSFIENMSARQDRCHFLHFFGQSSLSTPITLVLKHSCSYYGNQVVSPNQPKVRHGRATRNIFLFMCFFVFFTTSPLPVLSEWSDSSVCPGPANQRPAAPAFQYVCECVLQGWCRQAEWMEEALAELRGRLGPQLRRASLLAGGRALGGSNKRTARTNSRLRHVCVLCVL